MNARRWVELAIALLLGMVIGYWVAPSARYTIGGRWDESACLLYRYDTHTGKTWLLLNKEIWLLLNNEGGKNPVRALLPGEVDDPVGALPGEEFPRAPLLPNKGVEDRGLGWYEVPEHNQFLPLPEENK